MKFVYALWAAVVLWWHRKYRWARSRLFLVRYGATNAQLEGREALRKIADARVCAPDTVSAGELRGGPAVFFRHDTGIEVFIGHTYDHAASKFLEWIELQNEADEAPGTRLTSKLNRAQRRFWASNKRPSLTLPKRPR